MILSPCGGETLELGLRGTVGSMFPEIFRMRLNKALKNLLQLDLLEHTGWTRKLQSTLLTHKVNSWKVLGWF